MPEISRFFGIIIYMYSQEHAPPHFHAEYGEYEAIFDIASAEILEGFLPNKQKSLVKAWALIHQDELLRNWESLTAGPGIFTKISPLQ